jgi:hypothetical protein
MRGMPDAYVMEQSRVVPVDLDTAFRGTLPMPLPTLFGRWYGPISPVRTVRDQSGVREAVARIRRAEPGPSLSRTRALMARTASSHTSWAPTGFNFDREDLLNIGYGPRLHNRLERRNVPRDINVYPRVFDFSGEHSAVEG